MRVEILALIYQSVQDRVSFSFEDFYRNLWSWEAIPVFMDGELCGGVIRKGNELHVGFGKKPRGSILKNIKQILNATIKEHGYALTVVAKDNPNGLKFCARLDFKPVYEEGNHIYMRCEKSNYE